jgi:hypothetical protein
MVEALEVAFDNSSFCYSYLLLVAILIILWY